MNSFRIKSILLTLLVLFSSGLVFAETVGKRIDELHSRTMTRSLEKFLNLTNFLERNRYIYRHDARDILETFNTENKITEELLSDFSYAIDDLRNEIIKNPRVKRNAKERIDIQISSIINLIESSIYKKSTWLKEAKHRTDYANLSKNLEKASVKIGQKEKIVEKRVVGKESIYLSIALVCTGTIFIFLYRRKNKKISLLKKRLVKVVRKNKSLEKTFSLKKSFVDVVSIIEDPMAVVVDFNGNVVASNVSFMNMFSKYFNLDEGNWDAFFEENFYLDKTENIEEKVYKFRKNKFLNFFIASQIIKDEGIRYLTFKIIDSNQVRLIKERDKQNLNHGQYDISDLFEESLTTFSKAYELGNISIDNKVFESGLITYCNKEKLSSMFYKLLQFFNTYDNEMKMSDHRIVVEMLRVDGVLKVRGSVNDSDFSIDRNIKLRDEIKKLSIFVSETNGEFRIYKRKVSGKVRTIFELNIYDFDTAFENNINTVVENEATTR